jgi:hypothetical protein
MTNTTTGPHQNPQSGFVDEAGTTPYLWHHFWQVGCGGSTWLPAAVHDAIGSVVPALGA